MSTIPTLPSRLRTLTHYAEDDEDCDGEVYSIDVIDHDTGICLRGFSDAASDGGTARVDAFVDGLNCARRILGLEPCEIVAERCINDGET